MPIVPSKIPEKIAFFTTRETPWTTQAASIGLTAPEMTTMSGFISTANDKLTAHLAAQAAAKAATTALYDSVRIMGDYGATLLKQIKAKAEQVGGDSVYSMAQIPPPATPTPVGELAKPIDYSVELLETGALKIGWKCTQPKSASGVTYNVWRQVGSGSLVCLGGTGEKKFTDSTLPRGLSQVTYQIQAVRSTSVGPWAVFTVVFGVDTSGAATVSSVTEGPAAKIAA